MRKKKIFLYSLLIPLILFTFTTSALAKKYSTTLINSYTPTSVLASINTYRLQHGFSPLTLDSRISAEAESHSREMAEKIIPFGHDGFYTRTRRLAGLFPQSHAAAENVAYADIDQQDIIKQWVKSPGHRKNIEGNYNLTGIGIAYDKNRRVFITQIFLQNRQ